MLAGASTNQDGEVPQSSIRKAPGLGHREAQRVLGERLRCQKWVVAIYQKLETFQYFNSGLLVPVAQLCMDSQEMVWGWACTKDGQGWS